MDVGTEISHKIRSAIKAKLMELGAYVDDELPDYIMVMVANKKNRSQMASDLGLFLGTNTDAFTEWLHGLLGKLQTVNSDADKQSERSKNSKVKGSKERKREKKVKGNSASEKKKSSKRSIVEAPPAVTITDESLVLDQHSVADKISNATVNQDLDLDLDVAKPAEANRDQAQEKAKLAQTEATVQNVQDEVEDVRQLLVTEAPSDELAQELETTEEEVTKSKRAKMSSIPDRVPNLVSSKDVTVERISRSKSHSPERGKRKRKAPVSVIASVSRSIGDEEEYDPYNPAVGSVASVVKVTARKSSVPSSLQANRSLLLKAMNEAENSIAVKKKVAVTRPVCRVESPGEISPKRKRLDGRKSPPMYVPSKKDGSFRSDHMSRLSVHPTLSHTDARHVLRNESRQELMSRSRRLEHLRMADEENIVRSLSPRPHSLRSVEKGGDKKSDIDQTSCRREVKDEKEAGPIQNFQITTRVVSQAFSELHKESARSKRSPSPEYTQSLGYKASSEAKRTIASRLGKVVGRKSLDSDTDTKEMDKSEQVSSSERKRDSGGRSRHAGGPSRLGKDVVKMQCAAAALSIRVAAEKQDSHKMPDSRVVQCNEESMDSKGILEEKAAALGREVEHGSVGDDVSGKESSDDGDDLAKMIDDAVPELNDSHNDEFTLDLDDEDISNVVGTIAEEQLEEDLSTVETKREDPKKGTRFIVTLEGIDERQFVDDKDSLDRFRHPLLGQAAASSGAGLQNPGLVMDVLTTHRRSMGQSVLGHTELQSQAVAHPFATPSKLTPPKIQPFSISLKDSDDEHEDKEKLGPKSAELVSYRESISGVVEDEAAVTEKQAKLNKRCKYWPACAAGSACEYHHPTAHCKTFPNCKFGDQCLFIHPNCRFDSKCTRLDCPFTHTSRRPNLGSGHIIAIPQPQVVITPGFASRHGASYSTPSPRKTICHFFPNCNNANCAFIHPKLCHFGVACRSSGCPFYHPPTPVNNKLKWQAGTVSAGVQKVGQPTAVPGVTHVQSLKYVKPSPSSVQQKASVPASNVSSTSQ